MISDESTYKWSTAILSLFVALVILIFGLPLYRLFLHPLARVPGPRLAAVSNVWHAYHARNGRMLRLGKTLHETYGPAVRVGPDEVWFDSIEAFRAIYGAGSGYEKSDFYLATLLQQPKIDWRLRLSFPDTLDLLSERDTRRYRQQRRAVGPVYQIASLRKHEPAIDATIVHIVQRLRALRGRRVDLAEWMHIAVVECLGSVVLRWSPGFLARGSDGGSGEHAYAGWRRKSVLGLFPAAAVLSAASRGFARTFSLLWGITYKTPPGFRPFFIAVQRKVGRRVAAAPGPEWSRTAGGTAPDLLAELIALHSDRPDQFTKTHLRRMAITNFGAGHETTTSALVSVMAMIGTHPAVQDLAHAEAREGALPESGVVSFADAVSLRYVTACVREAQRLFPVIGMSLSRTVPPGPGLAVHGHRFAPGTVVGCAPVALHRNTEIFGHDAHAFDPQRWLDADGSRMRAMERFNLTWGGGARTCPGRHLAELVVFKLVPTIIREFRLEVVDMPSEDEVRYYFMAMLTGIKVRFVARAEAGDAPPARR